MLRRFMAYYRPYRGLFILDFSCAILAALLELAFPLGCKQSCRSAASRRQLVHDFISLCRTAGHLSA